MESIYDTLLLIVDNDVDFLQTVRELLTQSGFQHVIVASSCIEAKRFCSSQDRPYLVIMDFNFREMSDGELVQYIANKCEGIKVIVLSDSTNIADTFASYEYGALSYIPKDHDWETSLIGSVTSWIQHYKKSDGRKLLFREKLNRLTISA